MGNRYDDKLLDILDRYGVRPPKIIDGTLINSILIDAISKRCMNKTVAIWGVGKKNAVNGHCYMIINKYILNLGGLKWLIDSDVDLQGTEFLGYPIIAPDPDLIREKGIDIIIIASKNSRLNIREHIQKIAPQCEYFDLYEELEKKGVRIDFNFFTEQNIYTELYRYKKLVEDAGSPEEKQEHMENLIALYLQIRDFYYAGIFIKKYASMRFARAEEYLKMLSEIEALCDEVRCVNRERKGDIMLHLIDSARAMDIYGHAADGSFCLNVFSAYQDQASVFTNAYSTGPATYESMIGTVKQKFSFDENVYENNNFIFDLEEFDFLSKVYEAGIPIRLYISKDYEIMNPHPGIYTREQLHMPEKLWTIATDMAVADRPTLYLAYYPWELHFPMLCGYMTNEPQIKAFADVGMEDMSGFIEQQLSDCLDYVDKQFAFYKDLYPDESTTVIFADHSQPIYDPARNVPYYMFFDDPDRICHVTFMICDRNLGAGVHDELISMLDFNQILNAAVFEHKIIAPEREIVQYQFYNVQNRRLRQRAMDLGLMDYTEGITCFLSKDYLYAKTATGVKHVYAFGDHEKDLAQTEEGKHFMNYVEAHYNTGFPPFWTVRNTVS